MRAYMQAMRVLSRRPPRHAALAPRRLISTNTTSAPESSISAGHSDTLSASAMLPPANMEDALMSTVAESIVASPAEAAHGIDSLALPLGPWPSDLALRVVDTVHHSFGLDWWLAIACTTVSIRLALLPMAVHGSQQQAKMQGLRSELAPLQARVQASGGTDHVAAAEMHQLYERNGVNPMRLLALPLLQVPIFMSFFLGLRRLAEHFPDAHVGGAYWFVDLGATDHTYWLPAASGLSALALVRISVPGPTAGMNEAEAAQADLMKKVLSGVTLFSLPVAASMPSSVLMFWITNNAFSLAYTSLLQLSPTRSLLGLGPLPGPADFRQGGTTSAPGTYPLDLSGMAKPPVVDNSPLEPNEVTRAKGMAANTLAGLAQSMADRSELPEAISMQSRAVALHEEVARANEGEHHAHALREALWKLIDLQDKAGRQQDASESLEKWLRAGGDAVAAKTRRDELDVS